MFKQTKYLTISILSVHSCMCLNSKENCCPLRLFPDLIKSWKSWPRKKYFAVVKTKKGLSHLVVGGPRVLHSVSYAPHLLMWSPPSLHSGEEMRYRPRTTPHCPLPRPLYTPHCTLNIAHCTLHIVGPLNLTFMITDFSIDIWHWTLDMAEGIGSTSTDTYDMGTILYWWILRLS